MGKKIIQSSKAIKKINTCPFFVWGGGGILGVGGGACQWLFNKENCPILSDCIINQEPAGYSRLVRFNSQKYTKLRRVQIYWKYTFGQYIILFYISMS